jgi:hypothetical protein
MADRSTRPLYTVLLVILLAGCATLKNTPQQDYIWEQAKVCDTRTATLRISRISADGKQVWWQGTMGPWEAEIPVYLACLREQYTLHPYLDWIKARQGTSVVALSAPSVPTPPAPVAPGPALVPVWHVGDEWQFAYKSPTDSGTFVWAVNRIEPLDSVPHYVIKAGTRETFYRVSDLANTLERVDGVVVLRETPPRLVYAWPLVVGKSWDETHKQERPVERSTTDRNSTWTVGAEETVTVPAGTFRTLKITWRNRNNGAVLYDMWYAPDVKHWVKLREVLSNGIRERELVSFRLN